MAVENFDDLLLFFDEDDFATTATFTIGGMDVDVSGIYDNPQASRSVTDMLDITIPSPQFVCRTNDVTGVAEGDAVVINTINYVVRVHLNDGLGVSTFILEAV